MSKIYKCDACGKESTIDNLINFQLFRKKMAKKLGNKRFDCKDMCIRCYKTIFQVTDEDLKRNDP